MIPENLIPIPLNATLAQFVGVMTPHFEVGEAITAFMVQGDNYWFSLRLVEDKKP